MQFDVRIEAPPYGTRLAFSPDGRVLAFAAGDWNTVLVRLWDTASGKELCRYAGHRESVGALMFCPDGKLVASGSAFHFQKDHSVHVWEAATGRLIRCFDGHRSGVGGVAFSPDGLTAAGDGWDSTILLWDITGRRLDGRWHARALPPHELDDYWATLAGEDTARAYDAVWKLVASPEQAVALLRKHLSALPRPDTQRVARLLAELDSDDFMVRQRAAEELGKFGDAIVPELRRALDAKPPLETRRRVQQLLDQARDWTADRLRDHRAIQALEYIGSTQAKELLERLARGAPGTHRTEEAKAVLRRLSRS
jgi:hypothetical protein